MKRKICTLGELQPGEAVMFEAAVRGEPRPCFAIRSPSGFFAYLNVCAHRNQPVVVEKSATDGEGLVECRAHGARYSAESGICVEGPCVGARLVGVGLEVADGALWAVDDDVVDDSVYADEAG